MTEAQSWVLIGIFATAVIGMLSWQTIHLSNLFRAELGKATAELRAEIVAIDRDVQALTRKVFGDDPL
ncbi:MAG TPA: hypothetical protein VFM66_00680 [Agromyces sp.]|nr:hypothetical protein [Agromyces sp.]